MKYIKIKILLIYIPIVLAVVIILVAIFGWKYFRGAIPAFLPPIQDIEDIFESENLTDFPLELEDGFSISLFAKDIPGVRVIVKDGIGNFWVSQPKSGTVSLLEVRDGIVLSSNIIFRNLNKPHGLAINPKDGFTLYIAESDKISRIRLYSEASLKKLVDLPDGGRHFTRTIKFGPDDRLYVSIGSSCDTCIEEDERRAAIYSMKPDGSDFRKYADGLRNSVFFTWSEGEGRMWATEMGRDFLGDNLPPDEINIIKEGKFYGWPWYYGKNIRDSKFQPNISFSLKRELIESYIDIPAHSAPLGLSFIPQSTAWPADYWYNLFVAYHGSWNRSEPTGYKIVRFKLDRFGNYLGQEDFITGWLERGIAIGRPVDILVEPSGVMYITDDKAGVVYKIIYKERLPLELL